MALPAGKFFVRAKLPYMLIPKGGKKVAARIARDFVELITGFTERFNEINGTTLDPAGGLAALLNSGAAPSSIFSDYRPLLEQSRGALSAWIVEPGFEDGWRWLTDEFADWFVAVIVPRPYKIDEFHEYPGAPWLTKVIVEHPRGKIWMREFVQELRKFLWPNAPDTSSDESSSVSASQSQ